MALNSSIADVAANSYVSLEEATAYLELARVDSKLGWGRLSAESKEAALRMSASLLDYGFDWNGMRVDLARRLLWPRYGFTWNGKYQDGEELPSILQDAQIEQAYFLVVSGVVSAGATSSFETEFSDSGSESAVVSKVKAGSVEVNFSDKLQNFLDRNKGSGIDVFEGSSVSKRVVIMLEGLYERVRTAGVKGEGIGVVDLVRG